MSASPGSDGPSTGSIRGPGTEAGSPAPSGGARFRAVFFGSGRFAVPILDALRQSTEVTLAGIVTAPPRPAGRGGALLGSPVAQHAAATEAAPVLSPARLRDPEAVAAVAVLAPELVVLADYGQLVPPSVLALPVHGALNLHPSLLPRHRGAAPIPATILAGDRTTGVTLMVMDAGLDSGPIVAQVDVPLDGTETADQLEDRLAIEAARLLLQALPDWLAGKLHPRPQASDTVTLTHPLHREDGRLDPGRTAAELERQVRAYQPWPGSFVDTPAGRLIVWRAEALGVGVDGDDRGTGAVLAGTVLPDGDGLAIAVRDGALRLCDVQLAGGRRLTSAQLRRGHRDLVGTRVRTPGVR